jgi:hypothetical protein
MSLFAAGEWRVDGVAVRAAALLHGWCFPFSVLWLFIVVIFFPYGQTSLYPST